MVRKNPKPEQIKISTDYGTIGGLYWAGTGRAVVCLHGFLDSAWGWEEYAKTTHRPVYALNLPGFGNSSLTSSRSVAGYTNMLSAAILKLQLNGFTLLGHSMGGLLASYMVEETQPHSLGLIAPAGFGRIPLAEISSFFGIKQGVEIGMPLVLMNPILAETIYRLGVSGGHAMPHALRIRLLKSVLSNRRGAYDALVTLSSFSKSLHEKTTKPPVIDENIPFGALWGKKDRLVSPTHATNLKNLFPKAKVDIWDGVAHHPHVEVPERLHKWIEQRATKARNHKKNTAHQPKQPS